MLTFLDATLGRACARQVRELYFAAFPPEERAPFSLLRLMARGRASDLLGVYDGDTFIGLVSMVYHADMVYTWFLAVDEGQRSRGYGTAILKEIARRNAGKRLILCIENLDEPCDNLPIRQRRKAFYLRNGYRETGVKLMEANVVYEMLATAPVTYAEYKALMIHYLGRLRFHLMYKEVK